MLDRFILEKADLVSYSQQERSNIATTLSYLKNIINNEPDFREPFLGGSYKRGTMVKGISDVDVYLTKYHPLQLRVDIRKQVNGNFPVMTYGESKGLGFDRVLIYPTKPIMEFILKNKNLDGSSRAKFYVAITRARYSVGIVYNFKDSESYENIENWNPWVYTFE